MGAGAPTDPICSHVSATLPDPYSPVAPSPPRYIFLICHSLIPLNSAHRWRARCYDCIVLEQRCPLVGHYLCKTRLRVSGLRCNSVQKAVLAGGRAELGVPSKPSRVPSPRGGTRGGGRRGAAMCAAAAAAAAAAVTCAAPGVALPKQLEAAVDVVKVTRIRGMEVGLHQQGNKRSAAAQIARSKRKMCDLSNNPQLWSAVFPLL